MFILRRCTAISKFYSNGIDSLAAELKKMGQLDNDELVGEMLSAGAEVVKDEWIKGVQQAVKNKDRRSKGELEESIQVSRKVEKLQNISAKTVSPAGKDSKGVRNAEKAFILHYGKSGQPATLFVDDVETAAEEKAAEKMQEVFNDYMEREGL